MIINNIYETEPVWVMRERKNHQTAVRMPKSMWDEVSKGSEKLGISTMEWIRRAVQERIDREIDKNMDSGENEVYVTLEEVRTLVSEETQLLKKSLTENEQTITILQDQIDLLRDQIQLLDKQALSQRIHSQGLVNKNTISIGSKDNKDS